MAEPVSLHIAGQRFDGWKEIVVQRSLETLSGSFSLAMTDRWAGQPSRWNIEAGQACKVLIGNDLVLTGYIDRATYTVTGSRRSISISGRDLTADLIDCSADFRPGSWTGRRLEQIVADLIKPFGLTSRALAPTGAVFAKFAVQPGEAVFDTISRLCRQRGLLAITNPAGELLLTRPGKTAAGYSLELPGNIEEISFDNDAAERFSDYVLKGYGPGGDAAVSRPKATATDGGISRHRPLVIINDELSSVAGLTERAKWEASVRAARGQQVQVLVSGWRAPGGALYDIDQLVSVYAPLAGVDNSLLVSGVAYSLGPQGSRTSLTCVRKEAFSLEPIADPRPVTPRKRRGAVAPLMNL